MDGSSFEHSDSESGDSWTLLEHSPSPGDDAPDFADHPSESRAENHDKDEDTDGISIISDSEPESPSPCQLNQHYITDDNRPTELEMTQCITDNPPLINIYNHHESVREEDDLLGVDNIKHRTYVHRRNKRLSTVLNIIVLGSVITAAGVAIGHMWGAKMDCSMHTTPTVNKILSNLYKLQEENAYLRSKLKELTANNYQMNIHKASKQSRCRKMFEESLNNDNIDKLTKCLDDKFDNAEKLLKSHLVDPNYEKEFISDIDKLKNVYLQNKSWLDDEINQRLKQEEESLKRLKNKHFSKLHKINQEKNINIINEQEVVENPVDNAEIQHEPQEVDDHDSSERIISYADSLKSTDKMKKLMDNKESNKTYKKLEIKEINNNKKMKGEFGPTFDFSVSEEELKKDNRQKNQKYKPEKKKYNRQKSHKKQKRKNKYEQWEMKGGLMKDYDEISFTSSQDVESVTKNENVQYNIEDITHLKDNTIVADTINMSTENYRTKHDKGEKDKRSINNEVGDNSWFDKRATLRTEARKRLEQELFGESPNTAGWYFRRMHKREQCRAKGDNSTYRKLLKRNMNFKMKH